MKDVMLWAGLVAIEVTGNGCAGCVPPGWTSFESQKILSLSSDTDKLTLSRMLEIEKANFPFLLLK